MSEKANTINPPSTPIVQEGPGKKEKKGKGSTPAILILVAVVVLMAAAIGYLLMSGPLAGVVPSSSGFNQDIFIVSMDQLVLSPTDMAAGYVVTPGGNKRFDNALLSRNMGADYAKPFILNTGRVDGWDLSMERANPNDFTPEYVRSRVEIYETVDGASTALSKDWFWAYQVEERLPDEILDKSCNVGKDCISYMYQEVKAGKGAIIERYEVAARYQNIVVWVLIKGAQGEVNEQIALDYAQLIFDKIELLGN